VPSLIGILVFETPCQQQGKSMLNKVSSNYTKTIGASLYNILMTSMASMQLKGWCTATMYAASLLGSLFKSRKALAEMSYCICRAPSTMELFLCRRCGVLKSETLGPMGISCIWKALCHFFHFFLVILEYLQGIMGKNENKKIMWEYFMLGNNLEKGELLK
jgi:hypothetical protein